MPTHSLWSRVAVHTLWMTLCKYSLRDSSCSGNCIAKALLVDTFLPLHGTYRHTTPPFITHSWFLSCMHTSYVNPGYTDSFRKPQETAMSHVLWHFDLPQAWNQTIGQLMILADYRWRWLNKGRHKISSLPANCPLGITTQTRISSTERQARLLHMQLLSAFRTLRSIQERLNGSTNICLAWSTTYYSAYLSSLPRPWFMCFTITMLLYK